MKSFTTKLQFVLALLLFGTMQQIHAQTWSGTWNTNLGEVKILEDRNGNVTFGIGDYSFGGKTTKNVANMGQTMTGNYFVSPRSNSPQGTKPVDYDKYGDRGTFTMTIDRTGQTFKGEWKNGADASKKGPINGRIIYTVSKNNDREEDLKDRKIDVSGIKPVIPWVGTWKVYSTSSPVHRPQGTFKIIQSKPKEIKLKYYYKEENGDIITGDATLNETKIFNNNHIQYEGTMVEKNNTTGVIRSNKMIELTSQGNRNHDFLLGSWGYRDSPSSYRTWGFKADRISMDKPNMDSYQ